MSCFVKKCQNRCIEKFLCDCGKQKQTCQYHREIIDYQKISCLAGFTCLKCDDKSLWPRKINVKTTIGIDYRFCGQCVLEIVDPCVEKYLKKDQCPVSLNPARNGYLCDLCSKTIYMINQKNSTGWTWTGKNADYNYCNNCIKTKCSNYIFS